MRQFAETETIDAAVGAVFTLDREYGAGSVIEPHQHIRAQLLHAVSGVVLVSTPHGRWVVPTEHAVWIPSGVEHSVQMLGRVHMRSAYLLPDASPALPASLRVVAMTALMRALIDEALQPQFSAEKSPRMDAIIALMLLEIPRLEERPYALPLPAQPRLATLCRQFLDTPDPHVTIDEWAHQAGMSRRSFTRNFQKETGMSLSLWRRQAILLAAVQRLSAGEAVTAVALELGYDSAPAFTTMFKQMLGMSPRDYLASRRISAKT